MLENVMVPTSLWIQNEISQSWYMKEFYAQKDYMWLKLVYLYTYFLPFSRNFNLSFSLFLSILKYSRFLMFGCFIKNVIKVELTFHTDPSFHVSFITTFASLKWLHAPARSSQTSGLVSSRPPYRFLPTPVLQKRGY